LVGGRDFPDAIGHVAGAIPLLGPYVANNVDRAQRGDVAGALGELSWLLAPGAKKLAGAGTEGALAGAKAIPALREPLNTVADWLDSRQSERFGKFAAPQTGAIKTRLGNAAVEVAPTILRDPALSGFTRSGFARKLETRFQQAGENLDAAADARLASQQVKTTPLLKKIDDEIAQLTAHPADASAFPREAVTPPSPTRGEQLADVTGELADSQAFKTQPIGTAVEPAPNSSQIATLRRIRKEVAALGPVAPYEAIRRIRAAWDKVAKVKYLPATAQDALASQGDAIGAAKGAGALREGLAQTDPTSAAAYAQYHVYRNANDVVQAAEEADRVRPNRGRSIMARTAGAIAGATKGGGVGAALGATAAVIADKAAEMTPSVQLVIARRFAAVADALRAGDAPRAQALTNRIVYQFPAIRSGLKLSGKGLALAGRDAIPARLAAEQDQQAKTR
jgi:hypothetical protein